MCGITGIHFKDPNDRGVGRKTIDRLVNELLLGIEGRGKDATGIVAVDRNGKVMLTKRPVTAKTFVTQRKRLPYGVQTILAHTRWATKGKPEDNLNNHPIQYRTCYAIHNGHIYNDDALFEEHSLGRNAEVDSEIIPALFEKFGLDKAHLALQELEGNMAVAVVDPERFPGQLILAKGWSSPLKFIEFKECIIWSSETDAIIKAVKKVLRKEIHWAEVESLDTGELLYIENDKIEKLNFQVASYTRPAKKSTTTTYSYGTDSIYVGGATAGYRTEIENRRWDMECRSCGHTGFWHGKNRPWTTGPCFASEKTDGIKFVCRCIAFVEASTEIAAVDKDFCDGCGVELPTNELVEIYGPPKYLLCKAACLENYGRANVPGAIEVPDWQKKEEVVHEESIKLVARSTGSGEQFINWLLFECPLTTIDNDKSGYLLKMHIQFDNLYCEAERLIRDQVDAKAPTSEAMRTCVVEAELEEAEQHLMDIRLEGESCGIKAFELEETVA